MMWHEAANNCPVNNRPPPVEAEFSYLSGDTFCIDSAKSLGGNSFISNSIVRVKEICRSLNILGEKLILPNLHRFFEVASQPDYNQLSTYDKTRLNATSKTVRTIA